MERNTEVVNEEKTIENKIKTLIDGDRIVSFSDAVFAFAATLLVLKIDLPSIPANLIESQFLIEFTKLIPQYLANFLSFLIIAYYWRLHHKLFILIKRYDNVLIWINTLILIFVSFLPFPIDLFGEYPNVSIVVGFYSISLALVGFLILTLWIYSSWGHRLVDKSLSYQVIKYHTLYVAAAPAIFLLSTPLAYIDHVIAKVSWVMVIVVIAILNLVYGSNSFTKRNNPQPE